MWAVAAVGLVTVGLVYALAFALYPQRPWTALLLGTGMWAPFGAIVAVGLHGWRVRRLLPPTPDAGAVDARTGGPSESVELRIAVPRASADWTARRRRAPWVAGAVGLVMVFGVGFGVVWWMGAAVAAVIGLTLAVLVGADLPALRVVQAAGARALVATPDGLAVPIECVGGAAFERAVRAGSAEVCVRWDEIVGWEAFDVQHLVHVRPDTARFGPFPRFAIARTTELLAHEEALLAYVRRHLGVPIEVRRGDDR
jgi:hypothetical protein